MAYFISHGLLTAALFVAATVPALAQSTAQVAAKAAKPDPLDPEAAVPAAAYQSSFSQYRRLGDDKAVSWREANDTVTRIGGWRVYTREAQQPDPAAAAKPPQAAVPAELARPMPGPVPQGHGDQKTP
jgi:hypothetical protein